MGSRLIVGSWITMILVLLVTLTTESQIPFIKKLEFDNTCDYYTRLVVAKGCLTEMDKSALRGDLTKYGFSATTITAPTTSVWGQEVVLEIQAVYSQKFIQPTFNHEAKQFVALYKQKVTTLTKE